MVISNGASTDDDEIEVSWTALSSSPSNGGSTILSYNLQWDSGTNGVTWTNIIGYSPASTVTTYTITTSVIAGTEY